MSEHKPWQMLTALDELLAREGWQDDRSAIISIERQIADETAVGRLGYRWSDVEAVDAVPADVWKQFAWIDGHDGEWPTESSYGLPFLRSRDAAAMLEEAISGSGFGFSLAVRLNCSPHDQLTTLGIDYPATLGQSLGKRLPEPAARTRAALEAGWRLKKWPVRREK